jgi:small subunit ribosomal protein S2
LNIPVIALVDSNNSFDGVDYMIPANDDAMSSIDLFMNSISKIILESKPKKAASNANSDKGEKKSIKAKKILKAPEVKKVASKSKPTSKKPKDDKENLGDNRDE